MGQLISNQGGKRSRVNVSSPVGRLSSQTKLDHSMHYLPNIKLDLENDSFDLSPGWKQQQLITANFPFGSAGSENLLGRAKISIASHLRILGNFKQPRSLTASTISRRYMRKSMASYLTKKSSLETTEIVHIH
jgi:hypothetical protein